MPTTWPPRAQPTVEGCAQGLLPMPTERQHNSSDLLAAGLSHSGFKAKWMADRKLAPIAARRANQAAGSRNRERFAAAGLRDREQRTLQMQEKWKGRCPSAASISEKVMTVMTMDGSTALALGGPLQSASPRSVSTLRRRSPLISQASLLLISAPSSRSASCNQDVEEDAWVSAVI